MNRTDSSDDAIEFEATEIPMEARGIYRKRETVEEDDEEVAPVSPVPAAASFESTDRSPVLASPLAEHQSPAQMLPYSFAKRHGLVVVMVKDTRAVVAVRQATENAPLNLAAMSEVRRLLKRSLRWRLVSESRFEALIQDGYQQTAGSDAMQASLDDVDERYDLASLADMSQIQDLMEQENDAPIIRLINALFREAINANASDIHIETFEQSVSIRMRVDGMLREVLTPARAMAPLLVSRIKVMSNLDIAEKRVPQDGRMSLRVGGTDVDVRVSTMPAANGERVVMRILDKSAERLTLETLGMSAETQDSLNELIHRPHGIFLVTGPTGSGKTTSLYAALSRLNTKVRNIITVEDPIEYQLEGVGQTQVNEKVDMTFARGLRAILRQDPDVVMVGEIRDRETAEIAVQASLTGHLVLSTLHTNTAVGAVTRLRDMGIEPFLLASSLIGVMAQRLVRTLCDCKTPKQASPSECQWLGADPNHPPTIYQPNGCDLCARQGFRGRSSIYELIVMDHTLQSLIHDEASEKELVEHARAQCPSIHRDGVRRILAGDTTIEEVMRVTSDSA